MEKKLRKPTLKQENFCKTYLETGNKTEAVMQVYQPKNRHTAAIMADQLSKNPTIVRTIKELKETLQERVYDCLVQTDALEQALASAVVDLRDDDKQSRIAARKFISEMMSQIKDETTAARKPFTLTLPSR